MKQLLVDLGLAERNPDGGEVDVQEEITIRKYDGEYSPDKKPVETITIKPDGTVVVEKEQA